MKSRPSSRAGPLSPRPPLHVGLREQEEQLEQCTGAHSLPGEPMTPLFLKRRNWRLREVDRPVSCPVVAWPPAGSGPVFLSFSVNIPSTLASLARAFYGFQGVFRIRYSLQHPQGFLCVPSPFQRQGSREDVNSLVTNLTGCIRGLRDRVTFTHTHIHTYRKCVWDTYSPPEPPAKVEVRSARACPDRVPHNRSNGCQRAVPRPAATASSGARNTCSQALSTPAESAALKTLNKPSERFQHIQG